MSTGFLLFFFLKLWNQIVRTFMLSRPKLPHSISFPPKASHSISFPPSLSLPKLPLSISPSQSFLTPSLSLPKLPLSTSFPPSLALSPHPHTPTLRLVGHHAKTLGNGMKSWENLSPPTHTHPLPARPRLLFVRSDGPHDSLFTALSALAWCPLWSSPCVDSVSLRSLFSINLLLFSSRKLYTPCAFFLIISRPPPQEQLSHLHPPLSLLSLSLYVFLSLPPFLNLCPPPSFSLSMTFLHYPPSLSLSLSLLSLSLSLSLSLRIMSHQWKLHTSTI